MIYSKSLQVLPPSNITFCISAAKTTNFPGCKQNKKQTNKQTKCVHRGAIKGNFILL